MKKSKKHQTQKEVNSEAHYESLKDSAFGKNLFNMMSLKFKTTGQVEAVLNLLDELTANIAQQQADDDATYDLTSASYGETIDNQNAVIVDAQGNIDSWSQEIADDTDAHSQAVAQRDSLSAEQDNIEAFLQQLAETRQRENEAYLQRNADQQAISAGLDEVIALFTAELENDPNIDGDAAEAVLELLTEIKAAVEASITEDTIAENDAQVKYNNFVAQQTDRLEDIATDIGQLDSEIEALETEIASLSQGVADETIRRDNAYALRDATQSALDELTNTHAANTQTRASQTVLIGQVKARLRNADDAESFLQV
jgi:chromosome segregation ATPase